MTADCWFRTGRKFSLIKNLEVQTTPHSILTTYFSEVLWCFLTLIFSLCAYVIDLNLWKEFCGLIQYVYSFDPSHNSIHWKVLSLNAEIQFIMYQISNKLTVLVVFHWYLSIFKNGIANKWFLWINSGQNELV